MGRSRRPTVTACRCPARASTACSHADRTHAVGLGRDLGECGHLAGVLPEARNHHPAGAAGVGRDAAAALQQCFAQPLRGKVGLAAAARDRGRLQVHSRPLASTSRLTPGRATSGALASLARAAPAAPAPASPVSAARRTPLGWSVQQQPAAPGLPRHTSCRTREWACILPMDRGGAEAIQPQMGWGRAAGTALPPSAPRW